MASPNADLHIQSAVSAGLASLHRFVQTLLSPHDPPGTSPHADQTIARLQDLLSLLSSSSTSSSSGRPAVGIRSTTFGHARVRRARAREGASPSSSNNSSSVSPPPSSSLGQTSNTTMKYYWSINNERDPHLLDCNRINPAVMLPAAADDLHVDGTPASSCGSPRNDLHLSLPSFDLNQTASMDDHAHGHPNFTPHSIITTSSCAAGPSPQSGTALLDKVCRSITNTHEFLSPPLSAAEGTISCSPLNNFSLLENGLCVNQNTSVSLYQAGATHSSHGQYSIDDLTGANPISTPHEQYHQIRALNTINRMASNSSSDKIPQKFSAGSTISLTNTTADNLKPCISLDRSPLDLSLMTSPLKRKLSDSDHSKENCTCSSKRRKHKNKTVRMVPAISDKVADIPADEYSWRKYGQKPIKGSPYPRGYYKCSVVRGCPAKKHVERAKGNPRMLIVTYEGEHNHSQHHQLAPFTHQEPRFLK